MDLIVPHHGLKIHHVLIIQFIQFIHHMVTLVGDRLDRSTPRSEMGCEDTQVENAYQSPIAYHSTSPLGVERSSRSPTSATK